MSTSIILLKFNLLLGISKLAMEPLVPALFVIPLVFKIQGHIFQVYTLVSEIQDQNGPNSKCQKYI